MKPGVLVLADFSNGKWDATSFAMQVLCENDSCISIMQTYEKPGFGHFMIRNLIPHLEKITEYELRSLKEKILANYKIKSENINTISLMGDLNNALLHKEALKGPHNIILGTNALFTNSCTMQNRYLSKIIDKSNNPLFILPQEFKNKKNNKILFVGNPSKTPSKNVTDRILEICSQSDSQLEILYVIKRPHQEMHKEVKLFIEDHFQHINYSTKYIQNNLISRGIKKHMNKNFKDLIIIEKNRF